MTSESIARVPPNKWGHQSLTFINFMINPPVDFGEGIWGHCYLENEDRPVESAGAIVVLLLGSNTLRDSLA